MATFYVGEVSDTLVLHFAGKRARINAYTLAAAVTGVADAAKAANAILNPGYEIEVVVEALGSGSFRTQIRAILREGKNLFSADSARNIILAIVATIIYERVLAPKPKIEINVTPDEVVIVQGRDRVVVPRFVYDTAKKVEKNVGFRSGVSGTLRAIAADAAVTGFGINTNPDKPPPLEIPRDDFVALPPDPELMTGDSRILEELTELQILRAILERSKRRWEFVWNGTRISAPVLDDSFYDAFFAHRIRIAPGDSLRVRMLLRQRRLPDLGIFVTDSYEIVEVLDHIPRKSTGQGDLPMSQGA